MKEYAIVTQETVDTYRLSGFEPGNVLLIENRAERDGKQYITLTTPLGLAAGYLESLFDIKVITAKDEKSKRLELALKELTECMFVENTSIRETLEFETMKSLYPEAVREELYAHLSEFITNKCDDELDRVVDWIKDSVPSSES